MPGSRGFWNAVFKEGDDSRAKPTADDTRAVAGNESADFPWLCEQVFKGDQNAQRRRYTMVLFASRRLGQITPATARDGVDAVRAAGAYPALTAALERARVVDLATFANAARRATELSTIDDEDRAYRAVAQFQGALALVNRAASRGGLNAGSVTELVSSLSAIPVSEHGDYEGRVARWLASWLHADTREDQKRQPGPNVIAAGSAEEVLEGAAGPMEQAALRRLTGSAPTEPRVVDWEGTRYRLDLARAEATRLAKALGESPRPYLSSAEVVVGIADALGKPGLTRDGLRQQANALAQVAPGDAANGARGSMGDVLDHHRDVTAALQRAAQAADVSGASRFVPALRLLADDLLARGLMELAYATALGQRDGVSLSAADGRAPSRLRAALDPWPYGALAASSAWQRAWTGVAGQRLAARTGCGSCSFFACAHSHPGRR